MNMDLTDWTNDKPTDVILQRDCLHVAVSIKRKIDPYQIISYCLTEWPSNWNITENSLDQKLTFLQLYQQNITVEQLYIWSAPIDLIEEYQFYLNELSTSKNVSSIESNIFYNCTSLRFGRYCQYSFDIDIDNNVSLNEIISEYYKQEYNPTNLTCYVQLELTYAMEYVDCHNGIDEEYCWQLKYTQCKNDEYRCKTEQCISRLFLQDDNSTFECIDTTDENHGRISITINHFFIGEPTFVSEDISCPHRHAPFRIKWTSSCSGKRDNMLRKLLLYDKPDSIANDCWLFVQCQLQILSRTDPKCSTHCYARKCPDKVNQICPNMIKVPSGTFFFGHIFFVYVRQMIKNFNIWSIPPQYVCYNEQLCHGLMSSNRSIFFNNATCRPPEDFPITFNNEAISRGDWYIMYVSPLYKQLSQCNPIDLNISIICDNVTMYKCINSSKCISKDRICNGVYDCDYEDDENCSPINGSCLIYGLENLFKCQTINICITSSYVNNGQCDCYSEEYQFCDDEYSNLRYIRQHISFSTICDGFTELIPISINGENQTDETECDYWQCNNTYTRCDGFWNCINGADEINCDLSSITIKCPSHHHTCVSHNTTKFICLPLEKANDGIIDCLGAADEPQLCRSDMFKASYNNFYCKSSTNEVCTKFSELCYQEYCIHESQNEFCNKTHNIGHNDICYNIHRRNHSNIEKFLCSRPMDVEKPGRVHFALEKLTKNSTNKIILSSPSVRQQIISFEYHQRCHRGLPLQVWLNNDKNINITTTTTACLCPPSFYGNMCQYQNPRVSLTLAFQAYSDSIKTVFGIVIFLIDNSNERIIHSYQQITYIYTNHCHTKFNMYLIYANRPKLLTKNYSIHIDIYEKISLKYRGSLFIPINFSFLPVYRIAVQFNIPRITDEPKPCSKSNCINGQCIIYTNNSNKTSFCKCNRNWSGKTCTIPYTCTCASGSLCIGIDANNRSICICPLDKWGSQCLLHKTICKNDQNTTCKNGGQCIPLNENLLPNQPFICICRKGFNGKLCEIEDNQISISFHNDIQLPQTMLVYFIQIYDDNPPENGSIFKTISINRNPTIIYWSDPFHIVIIKFFDNNNNYYLVNVKNIYNQSSIILKTIYPSDRCEHISEVLNQTIVNYHLLRRIKYYHIPCQRRSLLLSCFYDDTHFCICYNFNNQRLANCFEFNSSIKYDCFGTSNCQHEAQCIQDRSNCPRTSICVCPKCYYGTRCEFTLNVFTLSLDGILGYHIQPHTNIKFQPTILKVSIALATILIVGTFINGVLSMITYNNKEILKVGCGLYLLVSSFIVLIIAIMFTFKISILIIAQMMYITNKRFLNIQCHSIDFLLHSSLIIDQWLNACVAMERAFTVIKGIRFNQIKSKQMAKFIIITVIVLTLSTNIHDPIYRSLFDANENDIEQNRIWCIVSYSDNFQIYNKFIQIFHFSVPFFINIISAIIIIIKNAQQRTTLQTQRTYVDLLREQFQQHKNLLISPIILIILAVPRLILYFVGGCMKSTRDSWFFLIAYFISFIPSMLSFLTFVLPSQTYTEAFTKTIKTYRQQMRRRFKLCSS